MPFGYINGNAAAVPGDQSGLCWLRATLPFIEQTSLYDQWDYGLGYAAGVNNTIIRTVIPAHLCPSDSPTSTWNAPTPNYNYAVNLGTTNWPRNSPYNGVVYNSAPFDYNSGRQYRLADIIDGTPTTLMLAEVRQGQVGQDLRGLTWYGPHVGFTAYYTPNTTGPDFLNAGFCQNATNAPLGLPCAAGTCTFASRSRHPGGVQVALCDGSGRFVTQDVDLTTWRAWLACATQTSSGTTSPGGRSDMSSPRMGCGGWWITAGVCVFGTLCLWAFRYAAWDPGMDRSRSAGEPTSGSLALDAYAAAERDLAEGRAVAAEAHLRQALKEIRATGTQPTAWLTC